MNNTTTQRFAINFDSQRGCLGGKWLKKLKLLETINKTKNNNITDVVFLDNVIRHKMRCGNFIILIPM